MMIHYFLTLLILFPGFVNAEPESSKEAELAEHGNHFLLGGRHARDLRRQLQYAWPDRDTWGPKKNGEGCKYHVDCVSGYCPGNWWSGTCSEPFVDGHAATESVRHTETFPHWVSESCYSDVEVCGICGERTHEGGKCNYDIECPHTQWCKEGGVLSMCGGTCTTCPDSLKCGQQGCHEDIGGEMKCGSETFWQKVKDLEDSLVPHVEDLAKCIYDATLNPSPTMVLPKKGSSTEKTCATSERNTKQDCTHDPCPAYLGEAYCSVQKDDSHVCMCKHGNYVQELKIAGHAKNVCEPCPSKMPKGNNDNEDCRQDLDCSSAICSSEGKCVEPETCQEHLKGEIAKCSSAQCDIAISKECLGFRKVFKTTKKGKVPTKAIVSKLPKGSKLEITWKAYGSVELSGYGEAEIHYTSQRFTASLKDTKLALKAGLEFEVKAESNYVIPETKVELANKMHIYMGVVMAAEVPIFLNIWAQPVAYYSFNGALKADARASLSFEGDVSFKEDLQVIFDMKDGFTKSGFELSNIKTEKELHRFWEMNGSATMNLKAKLGIIFSISVEGFQFEIVAGLAGSLMVAADVNTNDNKACGKDQDGKDLGGVSVKGEYSIGGYLTGRLDFNPANVDNLESRRILEENFLDWPTENMINSLADADNRRNLADATGADEDDHEEDMWEEMTDTKKLDQKTVDAIEGFLTTAKNGKTSADDLITKMKTLDGDETKSTAKSGNKGIDVINILVKGCYMVFDFIDEYLGKKYLSCSKLGAVKAWICGGIDLIGNHFGLHQHTITMDLKLFEFNFDWTLVYNKVAATCAINWPALSEKEHKLALSWGGSWKGTPQTRLDSFVKASKSDTYSQAQIGGIIAGCTIVSLLISWYVYGKFQTGDSYVSYDAVLLDDDVAVSTESLI